MGIYIYNQNKYSLLKNRDVNMSSSVVLSADHMQNKIPYVCVCQQPYCNKVVADQRKCLLICDYSVYFAKLYPSKWARTWATSCCIGKGCFILFESTRLVCYCKGSIDIILRSHRQVFPCELFDDTMGCNARIFIGVYWYGADQRRGGACSQEKKNEHER